MPEPRNDEPCPCGSGHKFEECCLAVPQMPPLTQDVLWPYVLANLQGEERNELLASCRVPRAALIEFAAHLLDLRRGPEVIAALEPRLDTPERYHDEDTAILLDLLCEAYGMSAQGAQRKLKLLNQTIERAPRSPLRCEAWQRLARIYMDRGDSGRAWSAFRQAQHDCPQADELCVLEVELLIADHRLDEAKDRAQQFVATLAGHGLPFDDPRVEFLNRMAANPADQSGGAQYKISGAGAMLREWLSRGADRELPLYQLVPVASSERCVLAPPGALAAWSSAGMRCFPSRSRSRSRISRSAGMMSGPPRRRCNGAASCTLIRRPWTAWTFSTIWQPPPADMLKRNPRRSMHSCWRHSWNEARSW